MKRFSFSFAALLLAAMTVFTSCDTDEKDEEAEQLKKDPTFYFFHASRSTSAQGVVEEDKDWGIHQKVFAVSTKGSEQSEHTGITAKLSDIFRTSNARTTIYGNEDDYFVSLTFNGEPKSKEFDKDTYKTSIGENVSDLMFKYLETGVFDEASMKDKFNVDALLIYKSKKDADASSPNFWVSYECTVNPTLLEVRSVKFYGGTFSARMRNKVGDTFLFTDGAWSCLGW